MILGKSAYGLYQVIVIIIKVQALKRCLVDGPDKFVEPVIIFRGFLQQVIFTLQIYGGQFKEQHRKQGNASFSALFLGDSEVAEPLYVELRA